jgi:hypothetical protein
MALRFSDEELLRLLNFSAKALGASDNELYEFTRCIRPDGSYFGTSGKCAHPNKTASLRSTLEREAKEEEEQARSLLSGGRRHNRAMVDEAKELLRSAARKRRKAKHS